MPEMNHENFNGTSVENLFNLHPGPFDRSVESSRKLHLPNFIDSHWLHHMGLNECEIRQVEAFLMEITGDLNELSGFTSIAALQ